jgi:hypothetical protein
MRLSSAGVAPTEPRLYPEYAPDYMAIFLTDPDGIRLRSQTTVTNGDSVTTIGMNWEADLRSSGHPEESCAAQCDCWES